MLDVQLTRHGIPKLTLSQGMFYGSSINILAFLEDCPTSCTDFESIDEYSATVTDATYCFPAIIHDCQKRLSIGIYIIRVNQVICCLSPTGRSILIIKDPQPVAKIPEFIFSSPYREWSPDFDASRGNPLPIAALPYFPEAEQIPRIRALVTYKLLLSDPRGDHENPKLIVHLLDESDEVRAYAKKQVALDLFDNLEIGKAYYITNLGHYRSENEFFFNLMNPNSLKLTRYTVVEECHDLGIPKLSFDFIPLPKLRMCKLEQLTVRGDKFTYVDVIGVLQTVGISEEMQTICYSKNLPRREVIIFDQSGQTLSVMLWSYNAEDFRARPGTIVAFRHARLLEQYSTLESDDEIPRLLSVVTPSTVHIEPEVEECFALRQWYNSRPRISVEATICEPCL